MSESVGGSLALSLLELSSASPQRTSSCSFVCEAVTTMAEACSCRARDCCNTAWARCSCSARR
ncbi:hypothetical protein PF007_g32896 [Phytophthora fragariae]|uniref:Uncharacterized protein n=1 Tax=Phytophthora fragariae TaxID=53985 RepID=A0A6A3PG41_9STRA|nr:hypothetical protein PF009_g33255 [Phytophthora fragariae]KAE8957888.1 hypothetical protein PF011_g30980 [Phytophthora fragariae]KAE9053625.1 hypothetical protein PF007_g32896 [Phytophthora fragariae]KAE9258663.1 hypothetical protein PF001_g33288 [Phytophthora fragariae]KAE9266993.1 hypothetical protein PF008_g31464 [Phytophthora fragariae]